MSIQQLVIPFYAVAELNRLYKIYVIEELLRELDNQIEKIKISLISISTSNG
jgi:hypothetical protein